MLILEHYMDYGWIVYYTVKILGSVDLKAEHFLVIRSKLESEAEKSNH